MKTFDPSTHQPIIDYRAMCCHGTPRPEADPGDAAPQNCSLTWEIQANPEKLDIPDETLDALGDTNWFQGMWPTDWMMTEPKFPNWKIQPVSQSDQGVLIRRRTHNDPQRQSLSPVFHFQLEREGALEPLYSGGPEARIVQRTSNLLHLVDSKEGITRSFEMVVHSHFLVLFRIRVHGKDRVGVRVDCNFSASNQGKLEEAGGKTWRLHNARGWHALTLFPGTDSGELLAFAFYDFQTEGDLDWALRQWRGKIAKFDAVKRQIADAATIEPFLVGTESPEEKNLVAAFVNRALRNIKMGGLIRQPSMIEFYGPEWEWADAVWICFQPACRYMLWIAPEVWANTMKTLMDYQTPEGMVPQAVLTRSTFDYAQFPNISPCVRDYYVFTKDTTYLDYAYPRFKKWYHWWMTCRNPDGNGVIAVGEAGQDLYTSVCEYKDNATDPTNPEVFEDTCMPLTRTPEIAGRPERLYLPDMIACQARMAEDLAFFARELGHMEDAKYFESEYRRLHDWVNSNLWDEETQYYYPVERATGRKIMKRSNLVYWLMWAGLVPEERTKRLVEALFDPKQFFTKIPVPIIALDDPSFNPKCEHWGDGYAWPLDSFKAFEALVRYRLWDRAAEFAEHYNRGVFEAIGDTMQPAEYYHSAGYPCGCTIMGTAGVTPLTFKRYLHDYQHGDIEKEWGRFIPTRL